MRSSCKPSYSEGTPKYEKKKHNAWSNMLGSTHSTVSVSDHAMRDKFAPIKLIRH